MSGAAFDELIETFEFLDDWEDRYRHLIELGRELPELEDALKTTATKIDGCASQVWLYARVSGSGPDSLITFDGDSDAMIVKGLIGVLRLLYSGQTAAAILEIDVQDQLRKLGLGEHLSSQRSNGLRAMVARIREIAASA